MYIACFEERCGDICYLFRVNQPLWKAPYKDAVGLSLPLRAWWEQDAKFFTKILSQKELLERSYLLDRHRQSERLWPTLHHQRAATLESCRGHNSLHVCFTTAYCSTRQFRVSAKDRPDHQLHICPRNTVWSLLTHCYYKQLPSGHGKRKIP